MKENDIGIFLHRTSYAESSAIVSYFTRNHGFQKFIFRGAKKKSSHLFPLNIQEIISYRRPESDLGNLNSAESTMEVQNVPFDPVRSSIAYFLAEILQKCLTHTERDERLFSFLHQQILLLDQIENLSLFPSNFLIQLTFHLGIEPQIVDENCNTFLLAEGEFVYANSPDPHCSNAATEVILSLLRGNAPNVTHSTRKEVLNALILYYKLHIENFGNLKTKDIVEAILGS
ncbi:MAG: DNA repair protein RecO [Crocinitomicaceae bacterium]